MLKLWLQYKLGKLSEQQYLVEQNIRLGQKIDVIRGKRLALKARLIALSEKGVTNA